MGRSKSQGGRKKGQKEGKAKTKAPDAKEDDAFADERFASARHDPRFKRFPPRRRPQKPERREDAEVDAEADEDTRFASLLRTDAKFAVGTADLKYDKRGKRQTLDGAAGPASAAVASPSGSDGETSSSDDEDEGAVLDEAAYRLQRQRAVRDFGVGAFAGRSPSPSATGDEQDASDGDPDAEAERSLRRAERLTLDAATSRIAVVDLDWSRFSATDILAVLRSFAPAPRPGAPQPVRRVTVYKSDYGIARLAVEDAEGPGAFLRKPKPRRRPSRPTPDEAASHSGESDDDVSNTSSDGSSDSSDSDSSSSSGGERMRAYERSKLRYYFAICEFASPADAQTVYSHVDGMEFDRSSSRFDLRFVREEDGVEEGRPKRDEATDVPADYDAPLGGASFYNAALQHTKVGLTWDQEDRQRKAAFANQFARLREGGRGGDDGAADADLQAYLASDSSSEEDGADGRDRLRRLLDLTRAGRGGGGRAGIFGGGDWGADGDEEDDVDMEVTFDGSLDALGSKLREKHARIKDGRGAPTVWETQLEARRAKRKSERGRGRGERDEPPPNAPSSAPSDAGFDDPFFAEAAPSAAGSGGVGGAVRERIAPSEAQEGGPDGSKELDLLMTRDSDLAALAHGHVPAGGVVEAAANDQGRVGRRKRRRSKKAAKEAAREAKVRDEGGFEVDVHDARFAGIYSQRDYALDPTHPSYKQLPSKLVETFHARGGHRGADAPPEARGAEAGPSKGGAHTSMAGVLKSLKRKLAS